jgi:squalene-hopene/tetraprenyl-beta-curcumene cyclase
VFYLRYHGYRAFFPLFALARYRNLVERRRPLEKLGF